MLKADFHMHSREDWHDWYHIRHSAKDLIAEAARQNFDVLSITHHNNVFFNREIVNFAKKRGIMLIPGAEARIEGKDVILINVTNKEIKGIKTLDQLEKIRDHALIIAPHPFYINSICLREKLIQHINNFHAIEYVHLYWKPMMHKPLSYFNPNNRSVEVAKKYKKPLVGTSDAHRIYEVGTSFTWVNSEKNKDDYLEAVKKGKVKLDSKPMPTFNFWKGLADMQTNEKLLKIAASKKGTIPSIYDDPGHRIATKAKRKF